jgi:hypothetical protein
MAGRSTIEIDSEVLESARREAERRRVSLEEFVEETLRQVAKAHDDRRERPGIAAIPVFHPEIPGTLPGVPDINNNAALLDYLDDIEREEKRLRDSS